VAETPDEIRDRAVKKAMGQEDTEPADDALSRARALPGQVREKLGEVLNQSEASKIPGEVVEKLRGIIRGPKVAPVEDGPPPGWEETPDDSSQREIPSNWAVSPDDPNVLVDGQGRRWKELGAARIIEIDGRTFQALE